MSEQSQGPGWWLASDGRWYPPEQAAPPVAPWGVPTQWSPPAPVPPSSGMGAGAIVAIVIVSVIGIVGALALAVTVLGRTEETSFEATGSSIGSDGAPSADVPEGFATMQGNGVSVALPERWTQFTAADMDLSDEELAELFPDVDPAEIANFGSFFEQGAVLLAVDSGSQGNFAANINVLRTPGSSPLNEIEPSALQQLRSIGGVVLDSSEVDLPSGRALRISYRLSAGELVIEGAQFYVPAGDRTYIVSISATAGTGDLADQIMSTFTVDG